MNHKIAAYIERQRNAEYYTEINDQSSNIKKADKMGQEFQLNQLELYNVSDFFDGPIMTPGEKWTRKFRKGPGQNTIKVVGADLNHLCIQYIRQNGPLEIIPKGSFNRQFYKMEEKIDPARLQDNPNFTTVDGNFVITNHKGVEVFCTTYEEVLKVWENNNG